MRNIRFYTCMQTASQAKYEFFGLWEDKKGRNLDDELDD